MVFSASPRIARFPLHWAQGVAAGILLAAFALPVPVDGSIALLPELCGLKSLTGTPCGGCGLTRSFVCMAHGQVLAAAQYHPLGPILFGAVAIMLVAGGHILRHPWTSGFKRVLLFGTASLFVAIWALRLHGTLPWGPCAL